MGSGHTRRNKRGRGRKNASGPRPNGIASQSNQGAPSGTPEFLPHASQLSSSEPVPQPSDQADEALELVAAEQEAFVVFESTDEDELDEMVDLDDAALVGGESELIEDAESETWAQADAMETGTGADGASGRASVPPATEPPVQPPTRRASPRLPGVPFARPDSEGRREWRALQPGEEQERSVPGERAGQNGHHANGIPNGREAQGFNGHRIPPHGRAREDGVAHARGNGHAVPSGERAERWPGAERDELAPRADVRGEVGPLIDELRAVFQRDRSVASAMAAARCGVCYLHYPLDELEYREAEGFYACPTCARALGAQRLPMVRRQKRM